MACRTWKSTFESITFTSLARYTGIEILCRELDRGLCFGKRCGLMATKVPQASTTAWRRAAARARTEARPVAHGL